MPFKKVKKNAIAIFGGVSGGYRRQKADPKSDNVPAGNNTSTPNSSTRLLSASKLDMMHTGMKRYEILPTRKSSESETVAEGHRDDDVSRFQHDNNTSAAGGDADWGSHRTNDNKHNPQLLSAFETDSGESLAFQNHIFGTGATGIMEGKARNNSGTQEGLVQQATRTAISPRWQNDTIKKGSHTMGSLYPRHMNLGRTAKVTPSTRNNDDQDLISAFDDIASRRGEEKVIIQQLPEPGAILDHPLSTSPEEMSPLRARRLEPPGSSTMPLSRDPPGSRTSSPAHHRVDPSGDTSTFAGRGRMIRVIEVNAPSPTRRRAHSLTPPMRRESPTNSTSPHTVGYNRRLEVQGDNSPRYATRRSNDSEQQAASQFQFHASQRIASLSPPLLYQMERPWSEKQGLAGPQHHAARSVDVENHGFSASFSSSLAARNTSGFVTRSQTSAGQQRHVESQTSETHAVPFFDATVSSRNIGRTDNTYDEINPFKNIEAPSTATDRRMSRHAMMRKSQLEPPTTTTTSQQLGATDFRIIAYLAERRANRSSMGGEEPSESLQTQRYHYSRSPEELPQRNLVSNLVDAFERGRPRAVSTTDEVPDKLVGPRKPRSLSEDFGATRRRLDALEDFPAVGSLPGEEDPAKVDTELESRESPANFSYAEAPYDNTGLINLLESITRELPVDSPLDLYDDNMRVDPRRAPLSETNSRRILNRDDPSQCTFWVTDAYGRCQYLELDVENANPQTIDEMLESNAQGEHGSRVNKIGSRLWKDGNTRLGELLTVEPQQQDSRFKIGSRLWTEGTGSNHTTKGTGSNHTTKGYDKMESIDDISSRSCLSPSNKKNSKRRNLKASLSFRAQSTKARIRRSFSFGSVR